MDFADGGKIDTVAYSAATGALSSDARAGHGAASKARPATAMIAWRNLRMVPPFWIVVAYPPTARSAHQPRPTIRQKLSQRWCDAKTGSMTGHRNLGLVMASTGSVTAVASGRQHRSNAPGRPCIAPKRFHNAGMRSTRKTGATSSWETA